MGAWFPRWQHMPICLYRLGEENTDRASRGSRDRQIQRKHGNLVGNSLQLRRGTQRIQPEILPTSGVGHLKSQYFFTMFTPLHKDEMK
jgi:hypothetical protein